ncbi:hypothetical protein XELAEV_18045708mg [Xenopus laevis]|uniref:Taste receptor type 2 n=1 Tax=Xenopus laevis TaxID=8355 RepID=A0A974H4K0_XENLA|nr:hypothetical protein XELAEV_18045708mg [Xenopus laevis]
MDCDWNNCSTYKPVEFMNIPVQEARTASVLFIAISFVGIITNMFIVSVNFHSWIKEQSMNPMVTTSLNIASLYKHIRCMQKNMGEFGGPNLKIHQRTVLTMTLLLIFYLLSYGLLLGSNFFLKIELLMRVYSMARCLFSPIQSIILIMGNSRLKQTCVNILNSCRKMFRERGNTPTICSLTKYK